ncbi:hypothetical protein ACNPPT_02930, partial [Paenibacillus sp. AGC30]
MSIDRYFESWEADQISVALDSSYSTMRKELMTINSSVIMFKKVSFMLLCLTLVVANGFIGSQWLGTASAAAPTTVTFSTTDSSVWADGIAEDGDGGSINIPEKVFQFYNISDVSGTMMPGTLIYANTEVDGWFPFLTTYETDINYGWKGMGIRTSDASEFQINGFFYSNWGEGPINIKVEGYRDGALVATHSFQNDEVIADYHSKHVLLNEDFDNVDMILLYSTDKGSWHGINDIVLDDAIVSASAPTINTQPVGATVDEGASSPTLSVGATVSDGGTLSYQWYSNATNSTTGGMLINGATSPTYDAPITNAGTTYYYAIVTNTNNGVNGTKTATATSNVAQVTVKALVHATVPTINTQPVGATVDEGASSPTLSVGATVSDGGTLSYQWYSNATNSTTGGMLINGATSPTYDAPITNAGTTYYYAIVTNTNNGVNGTKTATATSNVAQVTVKALVHATVPTINTQPVGATVDEGASSPTLSVGATVSDGGTLSYQWY